MDLKSLESVFDCHLSPVSFEVNENIQFYALLPSGLEIIKFNCLLAKFHIINRKQESMTWK